MFFFARARRVLASERVGFFVLVVVLMFVGLFARFGGMWTVEALGRKGLVEGCGSRDAGLALERADEGRPGGS